MTFNCLDCDEPVGTIQDINVPTRCPPCLIKQKKPVDRGPTVGEVLSDAQRFREEIEWDAAIRN